jgi:hypothetical protein
LWVIDSRSNICAVDAEVAAERAVAGHRKAGGCGPLAGISNAVLQQMSRAAYECIWDLCDVAEIAGAILRRLRGSAR